MFVCVPFQYFKLGLNATPEVAVEIFSGLKNNSAAGSNLTLGDIQATIGILDGMADASSTVTLQDDSMMNVRIQNVFVSPSRLGHIE